MKNAIYTVTLLLISIFSITIQAQIVDCSSGRYSDEVFPNFTKTSDVQYGQNISLTGSTENLLLDVYQPDGDILTERPLIIWAHGGSFVGGSKTGSDVVPLAQDFAKMGYVTACINYRLGMNNIPFPGPDSVDATETVVRSVHDARAAVRFFRKDYVENGNSYGIDTSKIFMGGVSAGGFIALHLAYLDTESEMPTDYIDTSQAGLGGGVEGNSGNPGYSSKVKAIINSCGALRDTAYMNNNTTPVISFHGNVDQTVPYGTDIIYMIGVFPIMTVNGSSTVHEQADKLGINNCWNPWNGEDHTPHIGSSSYYDSLQTISKNFLLQFVCNTLNYCSYDTAGTGSVTATWDCAIDLGCVDPGTGNGTYSSLATCLDACGTIGIENKNKNGFIIYPNPSSSEINIQIKSELNRNYTIELFNDMGTSVRKLSIEREKTITIERLDLASGLYFLQFTSVGQRWTEKIIFQ